MTANSEILLLFCLAKLCRPRRRQIDGAIKHNDNSRDKERERDCLTRGRWMEWRSVIMN